VNNRLQICFENVISTAIKYYNCQRNKVQRCQKICAIKKSIQNVILKRTLNNLASTILFPVNVTSLILRYPWVKLSIFSINFQTKTFEKISNWSHSLSNKFKQYLFTISFKTIIEALIHSHTIIYKTIQGIVKNCTV